MNEDAREDDLVRKLDEVALGRLGRGRRWAERAARGETIAIVGEDGAPLAYLIPATEPVTDELIAWRVGRDRDMAPGARRQLRRTLREFKRSGWRYVRAWDRFVMHPADEGLREGGP